MTALCPIVFNMIKIFVRPFCFVIRICSYSFCRAFFGASFKNTQEYMIYLWYDICKISNAAIFMPHTVIWDKISSSEMNGHRGIEFTVFLYCANPKTIVLIQQFFVAKMRLLAHAKTLFAEWYSSKTWHRKRVLRKIFLHLYNDSILTSTS